MSDFGIIALTPATFFEAERQPSIAIAAAMASGTGILDLEFAPADFPAASAVAQLVRSAVSGCGIKCDISQLDRFDESLKLLAGDANGKSRFVILTPGWQEYTSTSLMAAVKSLNELSLTVLVETINLEEAVLAESSGAQAVIAKGHEAAGRVGSETSFVLLQRYVQGLKLPVYVQGGVGLYTAAACRAGGAAGVVLDSQLLLTRESPLQPSLQAKLSALDGSETSTASCDSDEFYRYYARQGVRLLPDCDFKGPDRKATLRKMVSSVIVKNQFVNHNHNHNHDQVLLVGQDIAFARGLAQKYVTVSGVIRAIADSSLKQIERAFELKPLSEGAPLAVSHRTRYPIVQGAMTRVSDTAEFAKAVADNGALPFLALALMRKAEIGNLLSQSKELLGSQSWGVGILGFVPEQLRQEQMEEILAYKPPFALIAGGRPDQARALEELGIATYLHVPSPLLLRSFMEMGSRRFIFEGKECGGHVGPRSSLILWETMIDVLLSSIGPRDDASKYHVLFAGGIHDQRSAAMVAAMAAPLAARGVAIGILMGTAYLFTKEAVETGAIVEKFQEEALKCQKTVLLETGPGHSIRVIESPYKETFDAERRKLEQENRHRDEVRQELELMNLGRLRIASKGLSRGGNAGDGLTAISQDQQWSQGMYMIGQVAAMHGDCLTIAQLHEDVCHGGTAYLRNLESSQPVASPNAGNLDFVPEVLRASGQVQDFDKDEAIAIVGMSCLFPKSPDVESYWQNILNKVDVITEVPKDQWDWQRYYDKDPLARDKISSKWGGFLTPISFDPTRYGIPPSSLASIDPMQILILEAARQALQDAGYENRQFNRDKTSIILANAGHGPITALYSLRSMLDWKLAHLPDELRKGLEQELPEWTEDSFPGYLGNVTAGRVANRFDLGGINFSIDAACASSLAALYVAVNELRGKTSDVVLLSATDTHNQPGDYLSFSKTHALSPNGRCRTFDATADGIVISEGIAMLVLKRLGDAERDGDRIYALIRGIGGSSDGKDLSLTAPRPAGQVSALTRAYENACISPATVELVEAHGTGTVAGDKAEIEAMRQVFNNADAKRRQCAVGSVKTNIGHSKAAAGLASLIKVAKSLHHKILPPTIGVETPNPACKFEDSPFYINSELRPWIHGKKSYPRRAGVSAFGFGGTNFHTVLEEYKSPLFPVEDAPSAALPSELFLLKATSLEELVKRLDSLSNHLKKNQDAGLNVVAYTWQLRLEETAKTNDRLCLSIIAGSMEDLSEKISRSKKALEDPGVREIKDPRGIYFQFEQPANQKIACLFPGQGSQQVNMLRDLCLTFPVVRKTFEESDSVLSGQFGRSLSSFVFPPPSFSSQEGEGNQNQLTDTRVAQPAVGTCDLAMWRLLKQFGFAPDMVAGHSYGEYMALCAAGVFTPADLFEISARRGQILSSSPNGAMVAVAASAEKIAGVVGQLPGVTIANINAPNQCILSGERQVLEEAMAALKSNEMHARFIPVSAAFHSPHMEDARQELEAAISALSLNKSCLTVYSNTSAKPYTLEPEAVSAQLGQHLISPVLFQQQIENMYADGASIFVEVGPGNVLSNLVDAILQDKPHLAISSDRAGRNGVTQLQHLLGQLSALGLSFDLSLLFAGRAKQLQSLIALNQGQPVESKQPMKLTYMVNSASIWPANAASASTASMAKAPSGQAAANTAAAKAASVQSGGKSASFSESNRRMPGKASPAAPVGGKQPPPNVVSPAPVQGVVGLSNTRETQSANQLNDGNGRGASGPGKINNSASMVSGGKTKTGVDQVMLQFQETMLKMTTNFLQAQQNVMLAYLNANSQGGLDPTVPSQLAQALQQLPGINPEFLPANGNGNGASPESPAMGEAVRAYNNNLDPAIKSQVTDLVLQNSHETVSQPMVEEAALETDVVSSEQLVTGLLDIVSQRTGYPLEMLDPQLDLEADLGIDSIKRVEILSSFRKLLPESKLQELEGGIEKLAGTKTLQGIIDWIRSSESISATEMKSQPKASVGVTGTAERARGQVSRGLVASCDLAAATFGCELAGPVLIVSDANGVADELSSLLAQKSIQTTIVRHGAEERLDNKHDLVADLADEQSVDRLVRHLKKELGGLATLIHLKALDERMLPGKGEHIALSATSLFLLCKALKDDLSLSERKPVVMTATMLGGDFGVGVGESTLEECPATQGAVVGMIKTLAREWPALRARAVDFSRDLGNRQVAQFLVAEMESLEERVEIGYVGHRRIGLEIVESPVDRSAINQLALDKSSVVVVTGGARGITAEIAAELARQYQPTLILVGRLPRPEASEPSYTSGLESAREIKAAIIEKLRAEGQAISVAAVESVYQKLLKEREIRRNLARLEELGSTVQYFSVDVRSDKEFGELIDRIYDSLGRIDGIVHGAGVIEDAWIQDKKLDSFRRVIETKVKSALTLISKVQLDKLKFFFLFSSVVGRTGNAGQIDYVAANEIVNKLAAFINQKVPARVASLLWGPWNGGMAPPELEEAFARFGWSMIEPADGKDSFMSELLHGAAGDAEVLLVGQLKSNAFQRSGSQSVQHSISAAPYTGEKAHGARLHAAVMTSCGPGQYEFKLALDTAEDLYLNDHCFDGIPVLPMAMSVELFAEAALSAHPGFRIASMSKMEIPAGLMLEGGRKEITLSMKETGRSPESISLQISLLSGAAGRTHFKANLEMVPDHISLVPGDAKLPSGITASFNHPNFDQSESVLPTVSEIYRQWMFHGPIFQGVRNLDSMGVDGIAGQVSSSIPANCLKTTDGNDWAVDPVLLDSTMQLAGIWARNYMDITVLPTGFNRLQFFQRTTGNILQGIILVPERSDSELSCNLAIYTQDGRLAMLMEGLGGIGSKSFNRLASQAQELRPA